MRSLLRVALVVLGASACDKGSPPPPSAPASPPAASAPAAPSSAPAASAPAPPAASSSSSVAAATANDTWPCTEEFGAGDGATVTERTRFVYTGGPARCFVPPDIVFAGCPTEIQELDASGALKRMRALSYDPQGNLATLEYRRDGKVSTRLIFHYTDGIIDRMEAHDPADDALLGGNRYHKNGDVIAREQFDAKNTTIRKATYQYKDGQVISGEVDHGADGTIDVKIRLVYEKGRLARDESSDASGKVLGVSTYHHECP